MSKYSQVYQYLVTGYSSYWFHDLCPENNDTSPEMTDIREILMAVLPSEVSYETDRTLCQKTCI